MRKKVIVISLLVLAVAGAGISRAVQRDDSAEPHVDAGAGEPADDDPESISPDGASARCVEQYDLETLAGRDVAFAGTLESVDGDDVTFTVDRWYRGGEGDAVTLGGAGVLTGLTSVSERAFAPGDRLLVSGEGGFAWPCGFTRAYDDAVAAEWEDVFADG